MMQFAATSDVLAAVAADHHDARHLIIASPREVALRATRDAAPLLSTGQAWLPKPGLAATIAPGVTGTEAGSAAEPDGGLSMSTGKHVRSVAVLAKPARRETGIRRRWIVSLRSTRARPESAAATGQAAAGSGSASGQRPRPRDTGLLS
jgi:hypothetical protein